MKQMEKEGFIAIGKGAQSIQKEVPSAGRMVFYLALGCSAI